MRRLIAVGVGVAFLILVVIAFRGCLEARSDRGIRNYSQDIGTIMLESEQRGEDFFDALEGEHGLRSAGRAADRSRARRFRQSCSTAPRTWTSPGQMRDAQSATTLALRLRRDALDKIAENMTRPPPTPSAPTRSRRSPTRWARFYASDILWQPGGLARDRSVLDEEKASRRQDLPAGNFMPEDAPPQFLDQTCETEL